MNWRNGTISGTPTQSLDNTTYTVSGRRWVSHRAPSASSSPASRASSSTATSWRATGPPSPRPRSRLPTTTPAEQPPRGPSVQPYPAAFLRDHQRQHLGHAGGRTGDDNLHRVASNTAGSSSTTVNITVGPATPGRSSTSPRIPFGRTTPRFILPQFFDQITGNGSTWQATDIRSGPGNSDPGKRMSILVGDTMYFDAYESATGIELYAYDTSNHSWRVTDIHAGSGAATRRLFEHPLG